MTTSRIAIVGMACQYPEAPAPGQLWRNVLAQRRSFREIPRERLNLADYYSPDRAAPDLTYNRYAAVLDDYAFDRVAFNVPGPAYRSSDIAHWLTLDVAKRALDDAHFGDLDVDRRRVSVLIGNTLTGDYTRSGVLRLRWPYVRRAVASALAARGLTGELGAILPELERSFKEPFQPINEESLAGGLSNTISGRICNYFDFGGGGYTIDGACSSSLLTVISASIGLQRGDVDFALAGGVDLSIDPFELVGFAKTSALAESLMRVYDERSEGFWPGEGCGIVALAREQDARRWGLRVYATVAGFGVSSDGHGGITRPEADGHALAMRRAYDAAGYGPDSVRLFEGHGTGTKVGDAAEVAAISRLRRAAGATDVAALGSIKANIGHTKAAAGVAGLIKVVMSVHSGVLPPTTGSESPLPELKGKERILEVRRDARPWPGGDRRASVSAVGFGGINTHVTVEQPAAVRPTRMWTPDSAVATTGQDAELIPITADSLPELAEQCRRLGEAALELTFGRMSDLAVTTARSVLPGLRARAAVVARTPAELAARCAELAGRIDSGATRHVSADYSFAESAGAPRIGFLFSGQGSPVRLDAGSLGRRFPAARAALEAASLPPTETVNTAVAQPATVTLSAAAAAVLDELGIEATVAIGHSLGELTALHWAGIFDRAELVDLAKTRGSAMAACDDEPGAMAELGTDVETARELSSGLPLAIAAINAADRTVVSGPETAIRACRSRAATRAIRATPLRVSHAFHSALVAPAAGAITDWFPAGTEVRVAARPVISTVTGTRLSGPVAVRELLVRQVTAPVLFTDALEAAARECDVLVEVGPGRVLADLAAGSGLPALTLDAGAYSLAPFLGVVAAAYALGSPVDLEALVRNRIAVRPDPLRRPTYLANPCELLPDVAVALPEPALAAEPETEPEPETETAPVTDVAKVVRDLIAARTELPVEAIKDTSTFLVDLNLNSIAVAQVAAEAARSAGRQPLVAAQELAEGNVRELIDIIENSPEADELGLPEEAAGAGDWVRAFRVGWLPRRRGGPRRAVAWTLPDDCPPEVRAVFGDDGRGAFDAPKGVVLTLGEIATERDAVTAIARLAEVVRDQDTRRVVVCHAGGAASLVRTLHIERPDLPVRLLGAADLAALGEDGHRQVRRECETGDGFEELRIEDGRVLVPRLIEIPVRGDARRVGPDDTILVTGGGKGIGAEAALALGREYGSRIAVLGRSRADRDDELAANLDRMRAAGVRVDYASADITDPASVRAAVDELSRAAGPITGVLHAAGINEPALLGALTAEAVGGTWRTKVEGLRNVLGELDAGRLRLLVVFSSVIGRTGMRGEGHYAVANERVRADVEAFAAGHPDCKCLSVDWSVWSGVGMGAKLGVLESLNRAGVRPIAPEDGIAALLGLIAADTEVAPVVSGRFGLAARTLPMHEDDLPFLRFLEKPVVRYPGIELVSEATLSGETDRYLTEHRLDGALLFPMVAGLEAMAQVAKALTGGDAVSRVTGLRLYRPVTVPADGSLRIRIAGVTRTDGRVDVCIRSAETDFAAEHFRATYAMDEDDGKPPNDGGGRPELLAGSDEAVAALYRDLLFHGPRFQLVRGFRRLESTRCRADVDASRGGRWFVDYLPQDLLLGDLAARDAALHAAQAAIPHRRVLPAGADEVRFWRAEPAAVLDADSAERGRGDRDLVFDLSVRDDAGAAVETWTGLRLRAVDELPDGPDRPVEMRAAYLERAVGLRWGAGVALRLVIADTGDAERDRRGRLAVAAATEGTDALGHRPDGRPELRSGRHVSLSHSGRYTLVVISDAPVGADLETVAHRERETWDRMLGDGNGELAGHVAAAGGEDHDTAATRVWSAVESLRKLGVAGPVRLAMEDPPDRGSCTFTSGPLRVTTILTALPGAARPTVVAAVRRPASLPAVAEVGTR